MPRFLIGVAGILVILAIAYLLSTNRKAIRLRVVGAAFALQAVIAWLVLYVPAGKVVIEKMAGGVTALLNYAHEGTNLILGPLATDPKFGNAFAISALPVIIFFAALVSVLYHLGIMQLIVRWLGGAIEKVVGVSKVESLCAAANIFVGQSEAPLVIRPYLAALTPAQLFTVMSVGMAGVAGAAKEFNAGGKWRGKNSYVVLVEFTGNMLAHANNAKLVGKNMLEAKDASGKPFIQDTIKAVQARAESTIDLRWGNPNTQKIDNGKMIASRVPGQDAYVGVAYFE